MTSRHYPSSSYKFTMTDNPSSLGLGVIEGFFGPPWSWQDRRHYAGFLKRSGFSFYIYAPKRCDDLRLRWTRPWPEDDWRNLVKTRQDFAEAGVKFGVGLSPYALYRDRNPETERDLITKLECLDRLELDILGIFFDDMPEGGADLAGLQADIMSRVMAASRANTFVFCPTFYSDDPVLTRLSGNIPEGYLSTLGDRLAGNAHIFWTGPKVCSVEISAAHIEDITQRLGRPPLLWDNYPINDGARMSQFLHLRAFDGRGGLPEVTLSGHALNPMNQARLSEIPISTLSELYRDPGSYEPQAAFAEAIMRLCSDEVAAALQEDLERFQDIGLGGFSISEQSELRARYAALPGPYASEVVRWLDGKFSPTPEDLAEFATG